MNDTKYWVWLSMVFGTGNHRIWETMCLFSSAAEAYQSLADGELNDRLSDNEIRNIHSTSVEAAEELIEKCKEKGISVIGCGDDEYPNALRHILNPPAVLYYKGNISCLKGKRAVASVGARKASDYSINAASRICGELAQKGTVIISGFAVGIDIASHLAAANSGYPTVCVLGCGVDVDYPRDNIRYRDIILSSGGAIVSEFPPGTPPHSPNFPKRNRILAALGDAAIVFEASEKSGSLITAGIALEYGREVFCLPPGDVFSKRYSGNIAFLRDGARALYSSADVLEYFSFGKGGNLGLHNIQSGLFSSFGVGVLKQKRNYGTEKKTATVQKNFREKNQNNINSEENTVPVKTEVTSGFDGELTGIQRKITDILVGGVFHVDVLVQKLEIECSELMTELTELELLGAVRALPGNMYSLA